MEESQTTTKVSIKLVAAAAIFTIFITIAVVAALKFIESERQRDIHDWKSKLDIIVNTRHAAIDSWLEDQFNHLTELSHNASLQLYMTELLKNPGTIDSNDLSIAEAAYLRNLLVAKAESTGFKGKVVGAEINANVARTGLAGLALLDMKNRIIAATPAMPPLEGIHADFVEGLQKGRRGVLDMHLGGGGTPTMGFAVPVYAVHGNNKNSDQVGFVVGVKEVDGELYPLLLQPGASDTEEALLVRKVGNRIHYLSPLMDGGGSLKHDLPLDTPELAGAFSLSNPGEFIIGRDYRDERVLVASKALAAAPWSVLYKIDANIALADSEERLRNMSIILALIVVGFTLFLACAWWFGTSRRAEHAVDAFKALNKELVDQRNFLQLLTESLPHPLFIVTKDSTYRYANLATAEQAGIPIDDIPGKSLSSVLGPHVAKRYEAQNQFALGSNKPVRDTFKQKIDDEERVMQSTHIPMKATEESDKGVLVFLEDISGVVKEQEKRERIHEQIKEVLVSLLDCRDPNAVDHSRFVSNVAMSMAEQLELTDKELDTIKTAAKLMNLGKLLVPRDILSKTEPLTEDERKQLYDGINKTSSLLEGIDFDAPVAEIISQVRENWDGTGQPNGLKGDEIHLEARILNVANNFVAMTSARAYRESIAVGPALDILTECSGKAFDRRTVAALALFLEHRIGEENWEDYVADLGGGYWSLILA
jgi:PAS domain S-box-containing protein